MADKSESRISKLGLIFFELTWRGRVTSKVAYSLVVVFEITRSSQNCWINRKIWKIVVSIKILNVASYRVWSHISQNPLHCTALKWTLSKKVINGFFMQQHTLTSIALKLEKGFYVGRLGKKTPFPFNSSNRVCVYLKFLGKLTFSVQVRQLVRVCPNIGCAIL